MTTVNNPLVSVLMTAYNREQYIAEAIESVLASTYTNFELIIVDDCSTDKTIEIARSYEAKDSRVKVYANETNLTDYVNRNKAAAYAQGKYIKYVDSDDQVYYYTLDVMVNYMERFPAAGFGLSGPTLNNTPPPVELNPREIYYTNFNGYGHFNRGPLCSIIRLDAFNNIGGFSGARFYGDLELWIKMARHYNMVMLPADLFFYRIHDQSEATIERKDAKKIDKIRQAIILDSLHHDACPLSKEEIRVIERKIKKSFRRNTFFSLLHNIKRTLKKN